MLSAHSCPKQHLGACTLRSFAPGSRHTCEQSKPKPRFSADVPMRKAKRNIQTETVILERERGAMKKVTQVMYWGWGALAHWPRRVSWDSHVCQRCVT